MQLGLNGTYDDLACPIGIKCPDYKPFLCADGSCVSKKDFCTSHQVCTGNTPVVCFDRTCKKEEFQVKNNKFIFYLFFYFSVKKNAQPRILFYAPTPTVLQVYWIVLKIHVLYGNHGNVILDQ